MLTQIVNEISVRSFRVTRLMLRVGNDGGRGEALSSWRQTLLVTFGFP